VTSRRFFATVWRINAVAILLTALLACGVLAFATWQIYKDATRTRQVSDVVTVGGEQLDRSQAELGTFERVSGSSVLRAPLRLEQEYGFGSGSKESSSVQNYFYYDPATRTAHWLIPGYKGLFVATYELPEREYREPERPAVAIVYVLVDGDSSGDGRLTASDVKAIAVSNPSGSQLTRVLTGVDEVKGASLTAEGRILLLYTASAALRAAEIDCATHAVVRDGAVRARAPDGKGEDTNRRSPLGVE
jgi:hypothetical protein